MEKIYRRFYSERQERIEAIISVTLDAFEADEYWAVLQNLDEADNSDVATLASALSEFGLVDMAVTARQARKRRGILDRLDTLIADPKTLEAQVHDVVEKNPWILGSRYNLLRSNETLKRTIGDLVAKEREEKRPDVLLGALQDGSFLLVEFKRPSHAIRRTDEAQAIEYRDDLSKKFAPIRVLMIGKGRAAATNPEYSADKLEVVSWAGVGSTARNEVEWLLSTLGSN